MFCCTLLYVHFSIAIILMGKRELIALLNLSSWCLVMVERLFLTVPLGCLQFVIVVFPDHTHLLFPVYRGVSRQYGNGLGSIFKAALRTVIPILKPVAKASLKSVKKVAKDQGVQALKDIVGGENVKKKVLKQRGKTSLKSFRQSTINQLAINSNQKRKKPQSQSRHRTVKRGFKSRAKKFNPIKRLVFEKDIFDEK